MLRTLCARFLYIPFLLDDRFKEMNKQTDFVCKGLISLLIKLSAKKRISIFPTQREATQFQTIGTAFMCKNDQSM